MFSVTCNALKGVGDSLTGHYDPAKGCHDAPEPGKIPCAIHFAVNSTPATFDVPSISSAPPSVLVAALEYVYSIPMYGFTHSTDRLLPGSPHPARLDALQSASGLLLALFMWVHMLLVSSILVSEEAMYRVARTFEGYYLFGRAYPWLVSVVVAVVLLLLMLHAALALRKFPHNARQYRAFREHQRRMRHSDTTLWWWQVVTGFLLFFLAPMHLFGMFSQPDQIGPYASAARVYQTHWPLYLVLLFAVELHAAIGLYRLALKWLVLPASPPRQLRRRLNLLKWGLSGFFVALGLCTLLAYYQLGHHLRDHPGLRYPSVIELQP